MCEYDMYMTYNVYYNNFNDVPLKIILGALGTAELSISFSQKSAGVNPVNITYHNV